MMKKYIALIVTVCFIAFTDTIMAAQPNNTTNICSISKNPAENITIIIARHGEKPTPNANDRGVLNCRGENRALHIPQVMQKMFGTIDGVFAPIPHFTTQYGADSQGAFSTRPFQTALPTATFFNTGINACVGVSHPKKIAKLVTSSKYAGKTLLVVWEHKRIKKIAEAINKIYHASYTFKKWSGSDFDSLYIFRVKNGILHFTKSAEGLNSVISDTCPDTE
jgi:hypothetical protein